MSSRVLARRMGPPACALALLLPAATAALAQGAPLASVASDTPPHMTAKLTSRKPKSRSNWWLTPVTVTFTCTIGSTPLAGSCPRPITLARSGRRESVSRTITDTDHQKITLRIARINIDLVGPTVRITGPSRGRLYRGHAPAAKCVASDKLSGIRSCRVTKTVRHLDNRDRVTVSAVAIAKSGASATSHFSYTTVQNT